MLLAICMSSLKNVCFNILFLNFFVYLFLILNCIEPFVYFRDQSLVSHFIFKYYPPFCRLSLVFFMVFLAVQKLLSLIGFCLFRFYFILFSLGYGSKNKACFNLCQRVFSRFSFKFCSAWSYIYVCYPF